MIVIGDYLIAGTMNAKTLSGISEIGTGAFNGVSMLTTPITFDVRLRKIHAYAFSGCWNLSNLVIPASVTYIGTNAFNGTYNDYNHITPIYMEHTSDAGLTLEANWHGGRPVYYYSETQKSGCWYYGGANGTTPTLWP